MRKACGEKELPVLERKELYAARLSLACAKNEDTGCWEWKRWKFKNGYGGMRVNGRMCIASRISFTVFVRELLPGEMVLHHCDNRACINPTHLFAGSARDNWRDAWTKGRAKPLPIRKGEQANSSKLKNSEVLEIKNQLACGVSQKDLAKQYRVDRSSISNIKRGVAWSWM